MKQRITILIVDDLLKKREAVKRALADSLERFDVHFGEAQSYETARDKLKDSNFDFVILDIKIPAGGDRASPKWSRQLLRDIVEGKYCFPMHVFGLTAHKGVVDGERQFYEKNSFGFFLFDWQNNVWAEEIAAKIEYLSLAIKNGAAYRLNSFDYDIAVLVARNDNEFIPVKRSLFGDEGGFGHPLWPDRSFFGELELSKELKLRAALLCIGQTGLSSAAAITTQALQILRPRLVVMLGMCAGFERKNVKLLDVLIAREAACWQEGKSFGDEAAETFDPTAKDKNSSAWLGERIDTFLEMYGPEIEELLKREAGTPEYISLHEKYKSKMRSVPRARPGLVVSGSEVVASRKTRGEVMRRYPTSLGLEMEIYAVYIAAITALGAKSEFIAIKGVADFADPEKADATQRMASHLSAVVLKYLLEKVAATQEGKFFQ